MKAIHPADDVRRFKHLRDLTRAFVLVALVGGLAAIGAFAPVVNDPVARPAPANHLSDAQIDPNAEAPPLVAQF